MRAALAGVAMLVIVGPAAAQSTKLTPKDIQAGFFTGTPFFASTTAGLKFKMTYTPDGKAKRESTGSSGAMAEGTWKLSKDGFCTAWSGGKPSCYVLVNTEPNRYAVVRGATTIAVWSKQTP
jgi:hypothetical protein